MKLKNCPTPGCRIQVPEEFKAGQKCSLCLFHGDFLTRMTHEKIVRVERPREVQS